MPTYPLCEGNRLLLSGLSDGDCSTQTTVRMDGYVVFLLLLTYDHDALRGVNFFLGQ